MSSAIAAPMADAGANVTAVQAFERGTLGLSFGGAGFLILYYVGVLKVLKQLGIVKESTRIAGISSGALTAGAVCSGLPDDDFHQTVTSLLSNCREVQCAGRMDQAVRELLQKKLPTDAAERCNGRFYAGVTVMDNGNPKSMLVGGADGFKDRDDLINTLAASAYIPFWSGRTPFTNWRGLETVDGSLTAKQICPPGTEYCLRISSRFAGLERPSMPETFGAITRALAGMRGSAADLPKPKLPEIPRLRPEALTAVKARGIDIAPGLVVATSDDWDGPTWTELGLIPCDPDTCDFLYKLGQLDAAAWAEASGVASAAAARKRKEGAWQDRKMKGV